MGGWVEVDGGCCGGQCLLIGRDSLYGLWKIKRLAGMINGHRGESDAYYIVSNKVPISR